MKTCPKCQRDMIEGRELVSMRPLDLLAMQEVRFARKNTIRTDKVVPYFCQNCGYIEMYKEIDS